MSKLRIKKWMWWTLAGWVALQLYFVREMVAAELLFGLFFAAAVFPDGPLLIETKMGAIATAVGVLLALAAARVLCVGRFAHFAAPGPRVHAQVTKERA